MLKVQNNAQYQLHNSSKGEGAPVIDSKCLRKNSVSNILITEILYLLFSTTIECDLIRKDLTPSKGSMYA